MIGVNMNHADKWIPRWTEQRDDDASHGCWAWPFGQVTMQVGAYATQGKYGTQEVPDWRVHGCHETGQEDERTSKT